MIFEGYSNPVINPSLRTEVELDGETKIHYLCDPAGPRRQRRHRQRHHPYYTKTRTGGRDWERLLREHMQKNETE